VLELSPTDVEAFLTRLSRCLDGETLARLDRAFLDSGRDAATVRARMARRAQRAGDLPEARTHAERARALRPDATDSRVVLAEVVASMEGAAAGLALLGDDPTDVATLRLRARLAAEVGREDLLERDLSHLRAAAAGRPRALAAEWSFAARLEETRGNLGAALLAIERAHQLEPTNDGHLASVARIAQRAGQTRRAHLARAELCRRGVQASCQALEPTDLSRQRTRLGGDPAARREP
jgi:tetratricopeptide (TPR) repeat protein